MFHWSSFWMNVKQFYIRNSSCHVIPNPYYFLEARLYRPNRGQRHHNVPSFRLVERKQTKYKFKCLFYYTLSICICRFQLTHIFDSRNFWDQNLYFSSLTYAMFYRCIISIYTLKVFTEGCVHVSFTWYVRNILFLKTSFIFLF